MPKNKSNFAKGDWLVHRIYGVGQVVALEDKRLNQKVRRFYKVRTTDSTFWLPVEKSSDGRVDPLPSCYMVKKAIKALGAPAQGLSKDPKVRKKHIEAVKSEGSLVAAARLIRDLKYFNLTKKLTITEQHTFNSLSDRFMKIWSICLDLEMSEVQRRFDQALSKNDNLAVSSSQVAEAQKSL